MVNARQVILFQGEGGYILAECPSLPGCTPPGKTLEKAVGEIREAIQLYLDVLNDDHQPVPAETFQTRVVTV